MFAILEYSIICPVTLTEVVFFSAIGCMFNFFLSIYFRICLCLFIYFFLCGNIFLDLPGCVMSCVMSPAFFYVHSVSNW